MADLLLTDLDETLVEKLKIRAEAHGLTLEAEIKSILEGARGVYSMEEARRMAEAWQRRLAGRIQGDSADLIREDRDSR